MQPNQFDELNDAVKRDLHLLDPLPAAQPSSDQVARWQQAVRLEAGRLRHQRGWFRVGRAAAGIAAAVLLVLGLSRWDGTSVATGADDPAAALADWTAALDESSSRMANLLEGGWIGDSFGEGDDEASELEALFESFDASIEELQAL